jgi:hypothetical protein
MRLGFGYLGYEKILEKVQELALLKVFALQA